MSNFKDFTRAIAGIASALKGINTVVDDIPVPGSGGSSSDYSSTPHIIGKWTDGTSDVYEVTLTGTTPAENSYTDIDMTSLLPAGMKISEFVGYQMNIVRADTDTMPLITGTGSWTISGNGTSIRLLKTAGGSLGTGTRPYNLTLRYLIAAITNE